MAEDGPSPAKRPRQHYHRHHVLHYKSQMLPPAEPILIEQEALDKLLIDSIKAICEERGVREGIHDHIIESLALEAFRNVTEEFIVKLCMTVRRSMLAARRVVPIAPDFECVVKALDRQIPKDEILSYRTKPDINPGLLPTPPPEDVFHNTVELPPSLLVPELDAAEKRRTDRFIPASLPPLPSTHTYKATPVFPPREKDPRRIRELATEEGKFGEAALRKLASASKLESTIHTEPEVVVAAPIPKLAHRRRRRKPAPSEEVVFEETMRDLLTAEPVENQKEFEVGPVVSAEKRYWRPEDTLVKRRQPGRTLTTETSLSVTAMGKQRAVDSMDVS